MDKRIYTDAELRKINAATLRRRILLSLKDWALADEQAMGDAAISPDERRAIRGEVRWGVRWLRELDRSLKLKLPDAAAHCAAEVVLLLHGLSERDVMISRNLLIPDAESRRAARKRRQAIADETNRKQWATADKLEKRVHAAWRAAEKKGITDIVEITAYVCDVAPCGEATVKKYRPNKTNR